MLATRFGMSTYKFLECLNGLCTSYPWHLLLLICLIYTFWLAAWKSFFLRFCNISAAILVLAISCTLDTTYMCVWYHSHVINILVLLIQKWADWSSGICCIVEICPRLEELFRWVRIVLNMILQIYYSLLAAYLAYAALLVATARYLIICG